MPQTPGQSKLTRYHALRMLPCRVSYQEHAVVLAAATIERRNLQSFTTNTVVEHAKTLLKANGIDPQTLAPIPVPRKSNKRKELRQPAA